MVWPFKKSRRPESSGIKDVEIFADHLGLDLTHYGAGVALLSMKSGYSAAETASNFAVITIARDIKNARNDIEDIIQISIRGYAIMECLEELKESGFIRSDIWKNDAHAIAKIIDPTSETEDWIDKILSDPVGAKEPVAISRI